MTKIKPKPGSFIFEFNRIDQSICCTSQNPPSKSNEFLHKSNKEQLGRYTWNLLHSITLAFPEIPTKVEQDNMKIFLELFAKFYPCYSCSNEFIKYLTINKPELKLGKQFISWMCEFHNNVNQKLGKNIYDCRNLQADYGMFRRI